jgi:two-component system sensor histidine kinase AdeS
MSIASPSLPFQLVRPDLLVGKTASALIFLAINPVAGWLGAVAFAFVAMVATYSELSATTYAIGAIALAVCGIAFCHVCRSRQSLEAVRQAALRLGRGDPSVRIPPMRAPSRIAGLVDSFNAMADAIDGEAKERRLMTAGISHELRTPLTILKGRLHGIEDGVIEAETGETRRLLRQVEHILHIVEDLDWLTMAGNGALLLDRRIVDLEQIIGPGLSDLDGLLERHGVRISRDTQPAFIVGDPVRLTQIITNLVTNAAKHSHAGAQILVQIRTVDDQAVIRVIDEGPGFDPEDQDQLFMPYWRASAHGRDDRPGRGLGLSLTADLVRAHGGHILAENRKDRSGACFCVSLPLFDGSIAG